MRKIHIFLLMVLLSCNPWADPNKIKDKDKDKFYRNIDLRIAAINQNSGMVDKKPQLCNSILFETLTEPKLYREINTCKLPPHIKINTAWIYNHQVGDTVHFEYLLKSEFFKIKKP